MPRSTLTSLLPSAVIVSASANGDPAGTGQVDPRLMVLVVCEVRWAMRSAPSKVTEVSVYRVSPWIPIGATGPPAGSGRFEGGRHRNALADREGHRLDRRERPRHDLLEHLGRCAAGRIVERDVDHLARDRRMKT